MFNLRMLKISDSWIWLAGGLLTAIGLLAIFSATHALQIKFGEDPFFYVKRQSFSLLLGVLAMFIFAYFDYKHLQKSAGALYVFMLSMLLITIFLGSSSMGAQRWFQLGPFSFQPSEIAKILMVICLAAFLSERKKLVGVGENVWLLSMTALPFLLIFKQPDLGTALVFVFTLVGILIASQASNNLLLFMLTPMLSIILRPLFWLWIIYLLALSLTLFLNRTRGSTFSMVLGSNILVGMALPFIWGMLKNYQRQRIMAFLNPGSDPYGAGYHALQSKIAFGSGGFWGKGFLHGTQTQLQFIPEQHSDFIFSVIGEEFGFIGTVVVMGLFALLIWRALVVAIEARDYFGTLLASGIAAMTLFHVVANMGMTLGILPVVGIPLPFVSYGGSSLLMNLAAVGILQSIAMRRQKIIF